MVVLNRVEWSGVDEGGRDITFWIIRRQSGRLVAERV